jgi:hypothetical protein
MIRAYRDNFPNCHVELFEDMKKDAPALVNRIEKFLGVSETVRESVKVHNRGGMKWKSAGLGQVIKTISYKTKFLKDRFPWLRGVMREIVEKMLLTKSETLSPELRLRLENEFRDDLNEVAQLAGRNLDHWFSSLENPKAQPTVTSGDGATNG